VPFLPFVLLLAWQAVSRSASFALGWATALYFGQVPGREGRLLSVMSLLAAAWVIVVLGFALPLLVGGALELTGTIPRNFQVGPLPVIGLWLAVLATPPFIAASAVWAGFHDERSVATWLRLVPTSYPSAASLGAAVLEMVAFTPFLLVQRWRQKRVLVQLPLVLREGADDDDLADGLRAAMSTMGIDRLELEEATGPSSWPLRTVAFAGRHLLGAVVRGEPIRATAGELVLLAYATNVAIMGPKRDAFRARAALQRELAFRDVYLTWSEQSQEFEDALFAIHGHLEDAAPQDLARDLDRLQARIDRASLTAEEWNVLYRLRLQIEMRTKGADARETSQASEPASSAPVARAVEPAVSR
jgi:hypothetical protein